MNDDGESEQLTGGMIVETEAYVQDDPSSHSYRGMTPRNKSMFLGGGHAYVYTIYGIHECFNVVTAQAGRGEAVLVRALEPCFGEARMSMRRRGSLKISEGPARLVEALGIRKEKHDGVSLLEGSLRVYLPVFQRYHAVYEMRATRRINTRSLSYWRYLLSSSRHLSR